MPELRPWRVVKATKHVHPNYIVIETGDLPKVVARVYDPYDAVLIAAIPELIQAVKRLDIPAIESAFQKMGLPINGLKQPVPNPKTPDFPYISDASAPTPLPRGKF